MWLESLYTNLDLKLTLDKVFDFIKVKVTSFYRGIIVFHSILSIIFYTNYFMSHNKIFQQVIGIAMGQICSPDAVSKKCSVYG